MNGPIYITGAGIVSAIGVGKESTLDSLVAGMSGIRRMKYLSSCHQDIPVGEVQLSNAEMASMLGISDDPAFTRTALLGRIALREALDEARLSGDALREVPSQPQPWEEWTAESCFTTRRKTAIWLTPLSPHIIAGRVPS